MSGIRKVVMGWLRVVKWIARNGCISGVFVFELVTSSISLDHYQLECFHCFIIIVWEDGTHFDSLDDPVQKTCLA